MTIFISIISRADRTTVLQDSDIIVTSTNKTLHSCVTSSNTIEEGSDLDTPSQGTDKTIESHVCGTSSTINEASDSHVTTTNSELASELHVTYIDPVACCIRSHKNLV